MSAPKWQFAARFRRHAFGWQSDTPIKRIKEAIAEIKQVARKEPERAAEGAVILLEKISPALEQVDSSSGAIGSAVNNAIEALVTVIVKADVDRPTRQRWLERLWEAVQDDGIPYIELLGEFWGELCVTPELASSWADEWLPIVESCWGPEAADRGWFRGTNPCLASLYAAGRHQQLLELVERSPFQWWTIRQWGVKALAAMGKPAEAIRYAEESRGINDPDWQIAEACEAILLSAGLEEDAYRRYALKAHGGTTHLATFRAISKKYPQKPQADILKDLIARTPGSEGKWFATAKTMGFYDLAIELVERSPTDPRTLMRAARDFKEKQPKFALAAGMAALHWISRGHGYEITTLDVINAREDILQATSNAGVAPEVINERIKGMWTTHNGPFLRRALERRVAR